MESDKNKGMEQDRLPLLPDAIALLQDYDGAGKAHMQTANALSSAVYCKFTLSDAERAALSTGQGAMAVFDKGMKFSALLCAEHAAFVVVQGGVRRGVPRQAIIEKVEVECAVWARMQREAMRGFFNNPRLQVVNR